MSERQLSIKDDGTSKMKVNNTMCATDIVMTDYDGKRKTDLNK